MTIDFILEPNSVFMDENEIDKFSWSALFLVTACCSFLFNFVLKIIDGHFSSWLLFIAGISGGLGLLSWLMSVIDRQYIKKNKNDRVSS